MKFPEEYKNTVCCIKCRKLGIEYTGKINSGTVKNVTVMFIFTMKSQFKRIPNLQKLCLGSVIVTLIFLLSQGISASVTFFTTIFVAFFFICAFKIEKNRIRKIENIMKEHLENNFTVPKEDENIAERNQRKH